MPTFQTHQFGSFDGLDNRKTVALLFERMGHNLSDLQAREQRAAFLRRLVRLSGNGFAQQTVQITPCDAVEAYFAFTAITGCLGVDVDQAARMLEEEVRRQ